MKIAVFRIKKNKNYTAMSNIHLRDKTISMKAKGILSVILSLPDDWNYSVRGLAKISRESESSIASGLRELEKAGYLVRKQSHTADGRMGNIEYIIYEEPRAPCIDFPNTDKPETEEPGSDLPCSENEEERNTKERSTKKQNTEITNNRFFSYQAIAENTADQIRKEREAYREVVKQNIGYDALVHDLISSDDIDEIVEIMLDAFCSTKPFLRVEGENRPTQIVKSRLLKLNSEHIRYVLGCMKENTTKVRNIKQYLLAVLYNAPATISNYYGALVSHDMHEGLI